MDKRPCVFPTCEAACGEWQHISCSEEPGYLLLCPREPQADGFCHTINCHPYSPAPIAEVA